MSALGIAGIVFICLLPHRWECSFASASRITI